MRTRVAIAADGPGAARLNDPFMQIDRVDGKLHFEPPAIDIDPAQVRSTTQKVVRIDKPAAAGEWDAGDAKVQRTTAQLSLPPLPVQVFDMPRDAQSFEATRTVDVPGPTGGKATITIALRRAGAAAASAPAPPPPARRLATRRPHDGPVSAPATTAAAATGALAGGPRQTQLPTPCRVTLQRRGRGGRRGRRQGARWRLRTPGRLGDRRRSWRAGRRHATERAAAADCPR